MNGLDTPIKLGLIGDNIRDSRSPDLHRIAGRMCGIEVSYELMVPTALGKDFSTVFEECRNEMRGVNVTLPYKERIFRHVEVADPLVRQMATINTVVFEGGRAIGHNTDYSGFVAAFFAQFGAMSPGKAVLIGAGGVGRAVGFGLLALEASHIVICDSDANKAEALAWDLRKASAGINVHVEAELTVALREADGILNCTPLGMHGYPEFALPRALFDGIKWGLEAVYTPVRTKFKTEAEAAGINMLSGYELYFNQGIQAFTIFTGLIVNDLSELRRLLAVAPIPS